MVQAINRAFEIVRYVAEAGDGIRLRELAGMCGLKKTTVFNLAETLVEEGMLSKNEGALYTLGPLVTELYMGGRGNRNLRRVAGVLMELHRTYPAASIVYTELGEADVFGRLNFPPGIPDKVEFTDGMTLNPYLTVCGILYFAFMPEERLNGLRMRHQFEYRGLEAWGSEAAFQARVELARRQGWAVTPELVSNSVFKVGIPVRDGNGNLSGTITFTVDRAHLTEADDRVFQQLFAAAERISKL